LIGSPDIVNIASGENGGEAENFIENERERIVPLIPKLLKLMEAADEVCCSVLQRVAVRCSVLQCVAVCCSVSASG